MKVLIVGGSGNISTDITKQLLELKHDVSVINRGIRKSFTNVENIICDIKDVDKYKSIMNGREFDVVIDMLCYTQEDVEFSYELYKDKCNQFIVCSSTAAYQRPMVSCPVTVEDKILVENTYQYGYRKACIERFLQSKMNETNITIIRPSLTFGEGAKNVGFLRQNYNIIERINTNKPLISFGEGLNPFTFSFSPDVAQGFVLCCNNEKTFGKTYTITCGDFHYIDDLYNTFAEVLNKKAIIYHIPSELLIEYDVMFNHLYFEKRHIGYYTLNEFLADVPEFKPQYDLKKGVEMMINFFNKEKYIDEALMDMEDDLASRYLAFKKIMQLKRN